MGVQTELVPGSKSTYRMTVNDLSGLWSTRSAPHLIPDKNLTLADNVCSVRDGLVSKRPGNGYYGGSVNGKIGSGLVTRAMARFYPKGGSPTLVVQSGGVLYQGNDTTGAWTAIPTLALDATRNATFAQMYDPDMSTGAATPLIVCDGIHVPQLWDGTHYAAMQTGGVYLPNNRAGLPIKPRYVANWDLHNVFSGDDADPGAVWISDALRPERYTGINYIDSAGVNYIPYYPGTQDGDLGAVTGIVPMGQYLIVLYNAGIVVGYNTGTYGSQQYVWYRLPFATGCCAPRSIAKMDGYIIFFGGDRFYACDGQRVVPLPDEIPTVYATSSRSTVAPQIKNAGTVFGVRRGQEYIASFDSTGTGTLDTIVMFDTSANGGWQFGAPTGGAWVRWPTGMAMSCGIECRGPGDTKFPFYWGSSTDDTTWQHDVSTSTDAAAPIAFGIQTKSFFLDGPLVPKFVQAVYALCEFDVKAAAYTSQIQGYVIVDSAQYQTEPELVTVSQTGATYGSGSYGAIKYSALSTTVQVPVKLYPQAIQSGYALTIGLTESSVNPISVIGFVIEYTADPPH